ncbi:MAG: oxygen-independent coproporphyrinogen III oxidase [Gammaproteobacteria bacterium]|nr:oxygen-independent coproporphyrinogen III oxidase [Gammaproteobacteria bacterium]
MSSHDLQFDADLIRRYDRSGPRYTSYPTAVQFHERFGANDYLRWAEHGNAAAVPAPLSLYLHLPFCATVCYYCACNKIITNNRSRAIPYLEHLYREIEMQGALFDRARLVDQLHFGGGTPTYLDHAQMTALMDQLRRHFSLRSDGSGEYSIEVDPRETRADTMEVLAGIGFNRLSLGVQDFDPEVQHAVNRHQTESQTLAVMDAARTAGFRSINLDLIYGLPLQTTTRFERTLDRVIAAAPDRLSVFNYAHLPELFKSQRQIDAAALPSPADKLAILQLTIDKLCGAGYVYIGMDHFAKPDDELASAQRERKLYRNFQGYSTHAGCDLVALGVTGIGSVGDSYSQNAKTIEDYYRLLDEGQLPIFRGVELDADDLLRRNIITELICHFSLDFATIEAAHAIRFSDYFQTELEDLRALAADGLITLDAGGIAVQPRGRLLIRNICMTFDRYLREQATARKFSRVI